MIEPRAGDKHWAILEKYAGIHEKGSQAITQGRAQVFNGFGPEFNLGFQVVLKPDEDSQRVLDRRLGSNIESIAELSCAGFYIGGEHYPWHLTVLDSKYMGDVNGLSTSLAEINSDQRLHTVVSKLQGLPLEFTYVLNAGSSLLLACADIPNQIVLVRMELAEIFQRYKFEPLSRMENIAHLTAARLRRLPAPHKQVLYGQEVEERFKDLHRKPIKLVMGSTYIGPTPGTIPPAMRLGWV